MTECPLCRLCENGEVKTKLYYEDDVCVIVDCASHRSKKLIVLKRHTRYPMPQETAHLEMVVSTKFPEKKFRGPASLKDHFHLHEI